MKRFLAILVTLSMTALIFAGGSNEAVSTPETTSSNNGEIELVYLNSHADPWDGPVGQEIFDKFYEKYGIKVRSESYPFDQYMELVEVRMQSKASDFDVFNVDSPLVASYSVRGYISPFEDYMPKDELEATFTTTGLNAASYNGKVMTGPKKESGMIMVYNKDILDRHGIPYPSEDPSERMTWEELVDIAAQCVETESGNVVTWGLIPDQVNRAWNVMPIANSLGARWLSEDGTTATGYLNSEESIKAMEFYQSWFNELGISPKGVATNEGRELFDTGRCAFIFGDPVCYARAAGKGLNVGICPVPAFEEGVPAVGSDSWHVAVNAYSKNKEAAALFVRFITCEEGSDIFLDSQSNLGCNKARIEVITSDDYEGHEVYKLLSEDLENYSVGRPKTPGYNEWSDVVDMAIEDIRNGSDVKTSLDQAAARIDGLLARYSR